MSQQVHNPNERLNIIAAHLYDPKERDTHYGQPPYTVPNPWNVAQYLVDMHDAKQVFDFCGGIMFQLALSDKLRSHLVEVAKKGEQSQQPVVFDASKARLMQIPDYKQTSQVDNVRTFHGREIRDVPWAAGGMGCVLQLGFAGEGEDRDPEGWTPAEIKAYDGWGHDSGRDWRTGDRMDKEGFENFQKKFGNEAFTLSHRFYLHFDGRNQFWLSAEDGCEGEPIRFK